MSVNITLNGKFSKHCRPHPLLTDQQELRKAEEKERRKLRLLQVREESKKLAKKIRDEVNEEKARELQKLEATKLREWECWQQHALQRKGEEYRGAIFQIGTAHEAAKRENEKQLKQKQQQETYKNFRKQIVRRKCQPGTVQFSCQPACTCQQILPGVSKQYKCSCAQTDDRLINDKNSEEVYKRKRNYSSSSSESDCEDEGYKEQTTIPQSSFSLSSTCDSISSNSVDNRATQTALFVPTKNKYLIKTPAVYLNVEVGTDDSVTITAPDEINERHGEYSRKLSSAIRVSPRKVRQQKETTCESSSIQHSSTTTTLSSDMKATEQNMDKTGLEKAQNKETKTQEPKEKRFTIISELVKKQQESAPKAAASKQTTYTKATQLSPQKQARAVAIQPTLAAPPPPVPKSPRKASGSSKSSRSASAQPLTSNATTTVKSNSAACDGSGRVQFYDYNSKLAKERDQNFVAVSVQKQKDYTQPSAMQQAAAENEKERERQLEDLKKCQIMEERGQKALEREQIRRDCNELTEKLEVLSREYANQLPNNENQLHIFADKQLRKEGKMNSAIEKILQRPNIITCTEQHRPEEHETIRKALPAKEQNVGNLLNVASLNDKSVSSGDMSSDSCCSILLGYVDNQSRLVKQDLQNNNATQDQSKQERLKNLLKRLDQLRNCLIKELKNDNESKSKKHENMENLKFCSKEENLKQVIDSISEMRKEREAIMISDDDGNLNRLREREKQLKSKEAILDRKVREFYELQKQRNKTHKNVVDKDSKQRADSEENKESSSSDHRKGELQNICSEEKVVCTSGNNPLEIIITFKGDAKSVKIPQKIKRRIAAKRSPCKLSTLMRSPQPSLPKAKKQTPKLKAPATKLGMVGRQNSYDSNSTSYMSLPPELPTKIDDLAQHIIKGIHEQPAKPTKQPEMVNQITSNQGQQDESEISLESSENLPRFKPPPHLNPLIAQYVNRLLGMSRNSVHKLGVSSSDIETPGSSVINTTANITNTDVITSDERLLTLHNFIEENKSFIRDVEQSIRSQNNTSLENSMRMLDDLWRKRLQQEHTNARSTKKAQEIKKKEQTPGLVNNKEIEHKSSLKTSQKKPSKKTTNAPLSAKTLPSKSKHIESKTGLEENSSKGSSKSQSSYYSSDDKDSVKSLKNYERPPVESVGKANNAKSSISSSKTESDSQIARYAKLTENCTHRIAELTELINRVREEKQRLLEVTLSSVSDNGRHSTEYLDLPQGKTSTQREQDDLIRLSSSSEELTRNKQSFSSNILLEMTNKLSSADKNKQIANSRDSGIAESRPITALENRIDQEPLSHTSSESTMPQVGRKMKPPPTIKRFSPQLPEDELVHELSTIFEVDTPATSRINTAAGQAAEEKETAAKNEAQKPVKFPTFQQYIKQLDLDITQLDPDQTLQLQQEFLAFLECLQQNRLTAVSPKYSQFPPITAYIQQLAEGDALLFETMEESLSKLHISGIQPHNFPAVREYIRDNASKSIPSDEQQLLDTESLENVTDAQSQANTDNDTASLDIQEELKKRNIIKNSFQFTETKKKQKIFSSTVRRDESFSKDILAAESGVDKLSTSGNTSDLLDNDLKRMIRQMPGEMRKKSKDVKILSSTTTSTNASAIADSALRAASLDESSKDSGRALNFRDFLMRELQKFANSSSSTTNSSTDESLRSHFLHSLIGSLTPRTAGAASKSGGQTLDRQKTSTPVPVPSSQARSTGSNQSKSSSHLFSGESRLSSVHYQDRSVHFVTSEDANDDKSSE